MLEGNRYAKVRKAMQEQGIGVLEMFHDTLPYLRSTTLEKNRYPDDLSATMKSCRW